MQLWSRLGEAQVLELWEQGRGRHYIDRGLLLLGAAFPQLTYERLADLPIGARDAALFELRRLLFGARLDAHVQCPGCGERLEFTLDAATLETPAAAVERIEVRGQQFRLPTSRDLAEAVVLADDDRIARRLADLCYLPDPEAPAPEWPDTSLGAIAERMATADPLADVLVALTCPACQHSWSATFDIVQFLWEEIEGRAIRLLQDVHALARAYGWSESDVLAVAPERRAIYIGWATR